MTTHVDPGLLLSRIFGIEDRVDALPGHIALSVAREIIEGHALPGDTVNSIALSKAFNTSRTPVREALIILQNVGLIDLAPHRRPVVATLSPAEVSDIYALRARLHAYVGELVSEHASTGQLDELDMAVDSMRSAVDSQDVDAYFWSNVVFHDKAATFAGNHALKQAIDRLGGQVLRLRHLSLTRSGRILSSVLDHERLLQAYRDRDAVLAAALNQSLVTNALLALQTTASAAAPGYRPESRFGEAEAELLVTAGTTREDG